MKYFENVPTINYPFVGKVTGGDDAKVSTINTVDLLVRFRIKSDVLLNPVAYYLYEWKDLDRPDTVARTYYGDADFAWLVMMSAMRFDALYDFPLPQNQFIDYITSRYGSVEDASSTIHHYEDGDGDVIDETTYNEIVDANKQAVSILKYEDDANEAKRKVKLLSRKYLQEVVREYDQMLKRIKESRDILTAKQVMEG